MRPRRFPLLALILFEHANENQYSLIHHRILNRKRHVLRPYTTTLINVHPPYTPAPTTHQLDAISR